MPETTIVKTEFEPGFIITTDDCGRKTKQDIASILRAADIPVGLTYTQVAAITTLANLIVVLVRTLIDRQVLSESFLEDGDYNLEDIVETIEGMGGDFGNPDLTT